MVVQSWQRVPSTLLQEHCQREKRPRPSYRSVCVCVVECVRAYTLPPKRGGGGAPHPSTNHISIHPKPTNREVSLKPGEKGAKAQVILPDPKGQADRALRFLPTVASPDSTVARENAALLALLHVRTFVVACACTVRLDWVTYRSIPTYLNDHYS